MMKEILINGISNSMILEKAADFEGYGLVPLHIGVEEGREYI